MMGVGKSALGRIVAKKLNLEFVDTDLNIEKKYSMKIRKIFENKGEKFFRLEEEKEAFKILNIQRPKKLIPKYKNHKVVDYLNKLNNNC